MKNVVLCAMMSVVFVFSLSAQKVDLDKYHFTCAGMYGLPTDPLPEDFKTFNVNAKTARLIGLVPEAIAEEVDINGWRRMESNEKAHITIDLSFGNLIIDKTEIKDRKEEKKDKAGKVISTNYYYTAVLQYSMVANHNVKDYTGKVYKTEILNSLNGSHSSSEFSSYSAASNYISNNREELKDRFANELIKNYTKRINANLVGKWGLNPIKGVNDYFWLMDSKKHPEQDSMQQMAKLMKEKFAEYREGTLVSEFKEMMAPFIGYFERLPERYKGDEKNDKKLRYSSYYNLAKLYWYLDDPDTSDKYADLLVKNDYDPKDAEDLKKENTVLKNVFKKAKINKRHLVFDVSTFTGPK